MKTDYTAVQRGGPTAGHYFDYGPADLRIFYLTRRLAALEIDRGEYSRLFRTDALSDFAGAFAALRDEGLVEVRGDALRPTPRGMFFADSIAALFAWRQVRANRNARLRPSGNDNGRGFM
jgi:oxygen-independent coproporphyrinogen-3 oxidase